MNSIPPNPMIQPWITAATEDNTVVIRHADRAVVFTGPGAKGLMPELIAKLDGTSQVDTIMLSIFLRTIICSSKAPHCPTQKTRQLPDCGTQHL